MTPEQIRDMHRSGVTLTAIAEQLGRSRDWVRTRIAKAQRDEVQPTPAGPTRHMQIGSYPIPDRRCTTCGQIYRPGQRLCSGARGRKGLDCPTVRTA